MDGTRNPKEQYETLIREISTYDPNLTNKPKIIVVNKVDLLDSLPELPFEYLPISARTGEGLDRLKEVLMRTVCPLKSEGRKVES